MLSVTSVKGGMTLDRTPSHVVLRGSLRSLTTEGLKQLQKRVKEVYTNSEPFIFPQDITGKEWSSMSMVRAMVD